ncbi:uncharacterized protein LOC111708564 [Eurytemora carolleeae]|uniref:uncharacterized protein LOC111708564 n=1 Tax=Eurytemora carolleeae TaxID=1294199 RepID=UPI000C762B25|nr:uncharacterized protein LOC111708564 [Eurytemora carolleeae]|eukprot:XP_023337751.1 uncharacterized protein LOC111708564 [Eurytemora affinis]
MLTSNHLTSTVALDKTVRILSTTAGGLVRTGKLRNPESNDRTVSSFTLCFRSDLTVLDDTKVFGFADDVLIIGLRTMWPDIFFSFLTTSYLLPFSWEIFAWSSICLSFANSTGILNLVKDGEIMKLENQDPLMLKTNSLTRLAILKSFRIGQYAEDRNGFSGSIADLNIWDREISLEHMIRWTKCQSTEEGTLLSWSNSQWELKGYEETNSTFSQLCHSVESQELIFLTKSSYNQANHICRNFNAEAEVCENEETQRRMTAGMVLHPECEGRFWCGIDDLEEEGTWANVNTGNTIGNFRPWGTGEPNGLLQENCVETRITLKEDSPSYLWNDANCEKSQRCFFCQLPQEPVLHLRGVSSCDSNYFDIKYKRSSSLSGNKYILSGYTGSEITWNETGRSWILTSRTKDPEVYGTFTHLVSQYPFGRHQWKFFNPHCLEENLKTLHLTACGPDNFNCNDGTCVSLSQRCNLEMDCPDRSDEMDCTFLDIPRWYLPDIKPPPLKKEQKTKNEIEVRVFVLQILDIDIVKLTFQTQFRLDMHWYDSRLSFRNLKSDQFNNWVTQNEFKSIWVPTIKFQNTESLLTTINDNKASVTIKKLGNQTTNNLETLENYVTFSGSENKLMVSRTYNIKFICNYNLRWYPFDSQICSMNLTLVKSEDSNFLELVILDDMKNLVPVEVSQYLIREINVKYDTFENGTRGVVVQFVMGRMIISQVMTIYIPTLLIIMVSYLTTFFNNSKWFGHIITINLTAMLVLTYIIPRIC